MNQVSNKTTIKVEMFLLSIIVLVGLFFRISGIAQNHSFWSDEAFVSSISRSIVENPNNTWIDLGKTPYQFLQTLTTSLSFKIFGFSEWSARLPSALWGTIGIIFAFLIAKKYSNKWGGFIAGFLYTFLQLNLAHATQAKPYAAVQTLFLATVYFADRNLILALVLASVATLYNYIGFIAFFPLIPQLIQRVKWKELRPIYWILGLVGIILLGWFLHIDVVLRFIKPQYNWTTYIRELFWRQFGFISLPAIFGLFLIKDKKMFWGILVGIVALLFSWNFIFYSRNLRYLMPIFGILIVLFGIFWGRVGEVLFRKPAIVCLSVMALLFAGGYKIVRKPAIYYTPNADFFADVQNADYKEFFRMWRIKYPDFEEYPIFSGLFDSLSWYTHRFPTATFSKFTDMAYVTKFGYTDYPSLEDFIGQMSVYPRGFVMVHDWQSFMPDDIKTYVKENLKLELRVESLSVAPQEKWPLELYSWGFDK